MIALSGRREPTPPEVTKPTLFVVTDCSLCGCQITQVRDREGRPVRLDGRDPVGEWWAVKVEGQWRVMKLQVGRNMPSGGWRYAEHRCGPVQFVKALGGEEIPIPPGRCSAGCGAKLPAYGGAADDLGRCSTCRAKPA